jgi:hypothetical protein
MYVWHGAAFGYCIFVDDLLSVCQLGANCVRTGREVNVNRGT